MHRGELAREGGEVRRHLPDITDHGVESVCRLVEPSDHAVELLASEIEPEEGAIDVLIVQEGIEALQCSVDGRHHVRYLREDLVRSHRE